MLPAALGSSVSRGYYNRRGGVVLPVRSPAGTASGTGAPLLTLNGPPVTVDVGETLLMGVVYDNAGLVDGANPDVGGAGLPWSTYALQYGIGLNLMLALYWFDNTITPYSGNVVMDFSTGTGFPLNCAFVLSKVTNLTLGFFGDRFKTALGGPATDQDSGLTAATSQAREFIYGLIGTDGAGADAIGTWQAGMAAGQSAAAVGMQIKEGFQSVNAISTYRSRVTGATSRRFRSSCVTFLGV